MKNVFDGRPFPLLVIGTVFNLTELIFISRVVDEDVGFATCLAVAKSVHFLLGPLPLSLLGSPIALSCYCFRRQLSSGCEFVVTARRRATELRNSVVTFSTWSVEPSTVCAGLANKR